MACEVWGLTGDILQDLSRLGRFLKNLINNMIAAFEGAGIGPLLQAWVTWW